jgi:hypothetical protein
MDVENIKELVIKNLDQKYLTFSFHLEKADLSIRYIIIFAGT